MDRFLICIYVWCVYVCVCIYMCVYIFIIFINSQATVASLFLYTLTLLICSFVLCEYDTIIVTLVVQCYWKLGIVALLC